MRILQHRDIDSITNRIAVVGTFDGVHRGHRFLLQVLNNEAAKHGLESTVITFAQHPLTTIRPDDVPSMLSTLDERLIKIESCGVECCVVLDFNEQLQQLTAREFLEKISCDYGVKMLVMGFNTLFGKDRIKDLIKYQLIGKEIGIEVIQATEYGSGISSSVIRKMIADGQISKANEALGYSYSIVGKVVKGKQLGRTIGFPTANVEVLDHKKLIPATGVYAVDVILDQSNEKHRAMLNIGRRPTVDVENAPITIEAHIINYNGNLYEKTLCIEFLQFLRKERTFSSLNALTSQLNKDLQQALNIQTT